MVYTVEEGLTDFEAWGGGLDTWIQLTTDQLDTLEGVLSEVLGGEETPTKTAINDFLWFERETIAEVLGFDSWADLEENNTY